MDDETLTPGERNDTGRMLSGERVLQELERSERIFRQGSWVAENILGAGYLVRLSRDQLVVPDPPGSSTYNAVTAPDSLREFQLKPGDSALISTEERFSMDFDITALIGPRFRLSAQGLLILHGSAAHPGFGRRFDSEAGTWVPKDNERLTFIIANVGPKTITLRAGDTIAYLQFFDIKPAAKPKPIENVGFEIFSGLFSQKDSGDKGLSFFRNVKDMEVEVARLKNVIDADREAGHRQSEANKTEIDRVSNASNVVVLFGVYLIAVTLFGFMLTTMVDVIEKLPDSLGGWRLWAVSTLGGLYAVAATLGVFVVWRAVTRLTSGRS